MILAELNKLLVDVARSNYLVNDAFVGDVYTINGKENRFGCFVATPMNALKQNIGYIRYTYVLYYIDRLTKAEDNVDSVQSDAVTLLNGVIDFLGEQGMEVESGYEFTLFRQKFSDWCAGAYVTVHFNVPYNDCGDGEFNLSGLGLGPISIDRNGIYEPVGVDGYNRITVDVPQVGATEEWVDNEIDSKLADYATQEWVNQQGFLTEHQDLSDYATIEYVDDAVDQVREELPNMTSYATKNWVENQGYIKTSDLSGYATLNDLENLDFLTEDDLTDYATKNWANNQGFLKEDDLEGLATENYVNNQGFLKSNSLTGYATQNWVENQGFLKEDDLEGLASQEWVLNQEYITEADLEDGYLTMDEWEDYKLQFESEVGQYMRSEFVSKTQLRREGFITSSALEGYATQNWVALQGYLIEDDLCGYATEEWVNQQGFLVPDDLCGYATEEWTRNWVENQGYIKLCDLDPYATKNWVENQGYLKEADFSDYATKQWVNQQNFATHSWVTDQIQSDLTGYATEEWVLEKGYITEGDITSTLIWSGTIEDWEDLTEEERCSYLIAMIIE